MMKKLLTVLITAATMVSAMAEVPSLINYQGKLSDKSGTPVNGSKNFTVRIFDAKEGGKQIYEENVGTVTVKDGLYSFGFGEAGKSVVTPTEILARTDGEKQVFNYITKNKPILGNVTISGAGLSWTDDDGSSDATKFTSTLNKNSGAASAIFLTQAPDSGTEVSIRYDHNSDGVMGALSRGGQSWLEITVSGEALSPRERLVAVPYAVKSAVSDRVLNLPDEVISTGFNSNENWSVYITETTRNSFKLLIKGASLHNMYSKPVSAVIAFGVSGNDFKAEKTVKIDNGSHKIEMEINDVPPIGFGSLYIKSVYNSAGGETKLFLVGRVILSTYKK